MSQNINECSFFCPSDHQYLLFCLFAYSFFNVYFERDRQTETETLHEQGRGWEMGRHRVRSRLQALSGQRGARHRSRTCELHDHDPS